MKRKGKVFFPLLGIIAGFITFIFYPLSSRKWDIHFDEEMIAGKEDFLARLREGEHAGAISTEDPPPNIVIITADDLGKTDMSLYGGTALDTPNMDAFGKNGVTFTEGYCTSPICSPSRAAMLTGRYQQRYGFEVQPQNRYAANRLQYFVFRHFINTKPWFLVDFERTPRKREVKKQGLPTSEITLSELLGSSGYATGITGKWHLGFTDPFIPINRGFDYHYGFYEAFSLYSPVGTPGIVDYRHDYFANKHIWRQERKGPCAIRRNHEELEEPEYLTFRIAEEANAFLERNRNNPFFLHVAFSAPHTPFQAPAKYVDKFSHIPDENRRVYYAMIAALDDAVGSIRDMIESLGLAENTLIMFASDNGGATYTGATENAPLKGGKFSNFEGGLNVPLMIEWKDHIRPGGIIHDPVSLLDFFSTAAGAAGVPLPDDRIYDGVNLLPFIPKAADIMKVGPLEGTSNVTNAAPHEILFWRASYNKAVRQGPWKLIIDEKAERTILYNIEDDKIEMHNVANHHPEVVIRLKAELAAWERDLPGPLWPRVMDFRFIIDGEEYDFAL